MKPSIWRAAADKIAHGFRRGDRRYACGERIIDERFAHTAVVKCQKCVDRLAVRP